MGNNDEDLAKLAQQIAEKNKEVENMIMQPVHPLVEDTSKENQVDSTFIENEEDIKIDENEVKESKVFLKNMLITSVSLIIAFIAILVIVVGYTQSAFMKKKTDEIGGIPKNRWEAGNQENKSAQTISANTSPIEQFESLVKQLGVEINILGLERQQKLSKAGLDEILFPARLSKDKNLNDGRAILIEARKINSEFVGDIKSIFINYKNKIPNIKANEEEKSRMLNELGEKENIAVSTGQKISIDADNHFNRLEKLINLLSQNQDKWMADETGLYFKDKILKAKFELLGSEIIDSMKVE